MRFLRSLTLAGLAVAIGLAGITTPAHATTAAEWYGDCEAYLGVLKGTGDADDLDLTYCMGQSVGIVAGLETGTRIGALSMASLLTVLLELDGRKVFELFGETTDDELLGYCAPDDLTSSRTITVVADFLDRHPDKGELPVTAVFFEALQEAFPCADPESAGGDADNSQSTTDN